MMTAPYSPKARSHASTIPARIPGAASGSRHVTEPGELGVPERGGHVECGRVDGPERRPGGHDEEGGCAERLCEDDAGQRVGQAAAEQLAEERVRAHQVDQQDPAHQGRQRQGQEHDEPDQ